MNTKPLLSELHAHTVWSDGKLTVRRLADLYGRRGFDVLAITDHVVRAPTPNGSVHVHDGDFRAYLEEVETEAERGRARYGPTVLPGLEPTYDDEPTLAAHAVAIGLRAFVSPAEGLDAALVAAPHPVEIGTTATRKGRREGPDSGAHRSS